MAKNCKIMKMTKSFPFTVIIVSLLLFLITTGCDRNKITTMSVSLKMKTKSVQISNKTASANNQLDFDDGYVIIREIVFDGDRVSEGAVSITHEQISKIDLMTGVATPPVDVTIPPGEYRDINLGIEIQDEDSIPSIVAEGTYTNDSGVSTPVRFEFNSGEVFEAEASAHTFDNGSSAIAEIDFSPALWFSTVTGGMLDSAQRVNGVILINENNNSEIFDIVADKLDDATDAEFK